MTGTGTTQIPEGGTLEITVGGPVLRGRTLVNAGNTFLSGAGSLDGSQESTIINDGDFDVRDASITTSSFFGGAPTFINRGTLKKSSGNSSRIGWAFNNIDTGAVVVESGTLSLQAGGNSTGTFTTRPNTALGFSGTHDLTGAIFDNAGVIQFTGTANFDQGPVSATIGGNAELSGNLTGDGDVTFEHLAWTAGNMSGSGTSILNTTMGGVSGGRLEIENGRTIVNAGEFTMERRMSFVGNNNATMVNEESGVFQIQEGGELIRDSGIVSFTRHVPQSGEHET